MVLIYGTFLCTEQGDTRHSAGYPSRNTYPAGADLQMASQLKQTRREASHATGTMKRGPCWLWHCTGMPFMPALRRKRQENFRECQTSLVYMESSRKARLFSESLLQKHKSAIQLTNQRRKRGESRSVEHLSSYADTSVSH